MSRFPIPAADAAAPFQTEIIIRRSRFLTHCAHTPGMEAARAFVEQIRTKHADATHNCWAFVAGAPGHSGQVGFSDDGEPHGTAGRPMLQVLLHCGVGEITMVVTRWFGGVKLGTGGLVRAYQDSVRENLATLPLAEKVPDCSAPSTPCGPPGRVTAAFSRTAAGRQAISSGCSAPALCCSTQGSTA